MGGTQGATRPSEPTRPSAKLGNVTSKIQVYKSRVFGVFVSIHTYIATYMYC